MKLYSWEKAVKQSKMSEESFMKAFEAIGGYNAKKDSFTKQAVKNGWVIDDKISQDCIKAIVEASSKEEPANTSDDTSKLIKQLFTEFAVLSLRVTALENNQEDDEPVVKEKKPRKPIDWSNKAKSLLGTKYNGWSFEQDKLNIVCSKKGKKDIIVASMKNIDDVKEMLDNA